MKIDPMTEDEGMHCVELKSQCMSLTGKRLRKFRRDIRYRIFRLREGKRGNFDQGLFKLLQAQFEPGMTWESFTFNWDVAANDPLKVVTPYEWIENGGTFEKIMALDENGTAREKRFCDPAAFTEQEL